MVNSHTHVCRFADTELQTAPLGQDQCSRTAEERQKPCTSLQASLILCPCIWGRGRRPCWYSGSKTSSH